MRSWFAGVPPAASKLLMMSLPKFGGVVDDGVDATADIDRVVASAADDGVVVVATVEGVVAVAAIEQVVAVVAVERVVAATAEQLVVVVIAVDDVVERVAGAVDGVAAVEVEVFDVRAQRVGDVGFDAIGAADASIGVASRATYVADLVDDIDVVAVAAGHGVGTEAALRAFVAAKAAQRVGGSPPVMTLLSALPVPTNWSASTPM